jgi:hypothetical protein
MNISEGGPNAEHTLDSTAPGAVAGPDPREVVLRSLNRGKTWSSPVTGPQPRETTRT